MKLSIKDIGLIILGILLIFFIFKKPEDNIIRVPVVMEIPIPGISNQFPPLEFPVPKSVKPKPKLVEEFIKSDSINKDSLYADSIKERIYEEIFNDTIQDITVISKVQGKLLKQEVRYNIYPRMVQIDTFVNYNINNNKKIELYGQIEMGMDINNIFTNTPIIKPSLLIKNKKDNIISISYDSQNKAWLGYAFKF